MLFVDTAVEDDNPERPVALRNNIANLGVFIFNHTLDILADPQRKKLDILMEINRDIAAELKASPDQQKVEQPEQEKIVSDTVG